MIQEEETEIVHHSAGGEFVQHATGQRVLNIRRCSVCDEPTLATYRWIDGWSDPEDAVDWHVIYPPRREADAPRKRVAARYGEMLELIHAPDVFAVRAGKLLRQCAPTGEFRVLRASGRTFLWPNV